MMKIKSDIAKLRMKKFVTFLIRLKWITTSKTSVFPPIPNTIENV